MNVPEKVMIIFLIGFPIWFVGSYIEEFILILVGSCFMLLSSVRFLLWVYEDREEENIV